MPRPAEARPAGRLCHPCAESPGGLFACLAALFAAHRRGCERVREVSERGRHSSPRVHTTTMRGDCWVSHSPRIVPRTFTPHLSCRRRMLRAAALRSVGGAAQRGSRLLPRQQVRSMAGGGPRGYGSGEYRGLKVPVPEKWQSNVATVYATMMWLWIFHRFRHDGKAMLVRQAARTRSGRLRLLPWVVRAGTAARSSGADLSCAPSHRVSSIPGTRIINLSAPHLCTARSGCACLPSRPWRCYRLLPVCLVTVLLWPAAPCGVGY